MAIEDPIDFTTVQEITAANLLAITNRQIAEIMLHGQSMGGQGRNLTRADLNALMKFRDSLQVEVAATTDEIGDGNILVNLR